MIAQPHQVSGDRFLIVSGTRCAELSSMVRNPATDCAASGERVLRLDSNALTMLDNEQGIAFGALLNRASYFLSAA